MPVQRSERLRMCQLRLSNCVLNMADELAQEPGRMKRADLAAFKSVEEVEKLKNVWLRARLFDSTILPAPTSETYTSET